MQGSNGLHAVLRRSSGTHTPQAQVGVFPEVYYSRDLAIFQYVCSRSSFWPPSSKSSFPDDLTSQKHRDTPSSLAYHHAAGYLNIKCQCLRQCWRKQRQQGGGFLIPARPLGWPLGVHDQWPTAQKFCHYKPRWRFVLSVWQKLYLARSSLKEQMQTCPSTQLGCAPVSVRSSMWYLTQFIIQYSNRPGHINGIWLNKVY